MNGAKPDVVATHRAFGEPLGWTIEQTISHMLKVSAALRRMGNAAAADKTEACVSAYLVRAEGAAS